MEVGKCEQALPKFFAKIRKYETVFTSIFSSYLLVFHCVFSDALLLDEPTNHLGTSLRYLFVQKSTLKYASHRSRFGTMARKIP